MSITAKEGNISNIPWLEEEVLGCKFIFQHSWVRVEIKSNICMQTWYLRGKWTSRVWDEWGLHWTFVRDHVLCEKRGHLHRPHGAGKNNGVFPFLFYYFVKKCSLGSVLRHSENMHCHIQPYELYDLKVITNLLKKLRCKFQSLCIFLEILAWLHKMLC